MNIALQLTLIYWAISLSLQITIVIWGKLHGRWLIKKLGEIMSEIRGELVEYRIPFILTPEEQEELDDIVEEAGDSSLNRMLSLLWALVHLPGLIFIRIPEEGGTINPYGVVIGAYVVLIGLIWIIYGITA
ncbi:MAG TPA: hypothetical protein DD473_27120 [Planctomycetaceae bacterium]|nr:hypothetical protein [Planctomycetaceae bacterium]